MIDVKTGFFNIEIAGPDFPAASPGISIFWKGNLLVINELTRRVRTFVVGTQLHFNGCTVTVKGMPNTACIPGITWMGRLLETIT